ncbi:hypothetical protein [Amycolatopsis sp. SID8362]|uniref:hypothetical protein n=1 Tax=Amycolatopsis sp. SID8362 TaxID=2690346 RepID=UPI00136BC6A1|nr:hypothetical protein [Amycolatopsis sp. SID8362]NBH05465.1 hypothetical protein [Amycolatopsis sp. SID8362]NED42165.1 hypothetical protein [Amycolatopsis sp. SID8362]
MVKKTLIGLMAASTATLALAAPASAAEVSWGLTQQVEPGGRIDAETHAALGGCSPKTTVMSKGFAAPLVFTEGGNWGRAGGHTTAITTPGKYTAQFTCSDGRVATGSFTILGTPPPSSSAHPKPPTTKPKPPATSKAPKPAKPQVAVKPAGAPQTGDGSLS